MFMGKFIKKTLKSFKKNLKDMSMSSCKLKSLSFLLFQQNET